MLDYDKRMNEQKEVLRLARRLITAREMFPSVPDRLKSDSVVVGLIDIVITPAVFLGRPPGHKIDPFKIGALEAVRTLIGGMMQGGLPGKNAYGFFTLKDLNLLFYIHAYLTDADQNSDIPFLSPETRGLDEQPS